MAQAKVTNFFRARKGSEDIHPSKRRKVESLNAFDSTVVSLPPEKVTAPEGPKVLRSRRGKKVENVASENLNVQTVNKGSVSQVRECSLFT